MESKLVVIERLEPHFHSLTLPFSCMSCLKTGHCSYVGVINLGMTGYVWMGFNLNKGSLQSLLSNSPF